MNSVVGTTLLYFGMTRKRKFEERVPNVDELRSSGIPVIYSKNRRVNSDSRVVNDVQWKQRLQEIQRQSLTVQEHNACLQELLSLNVHRLSLEELKKVLGLMRQPYKIDYTVLLNASRKHSETAPEVFDYLFAQPGVFSDEKTKKIIEEHLLHVVSVKRDFELAQKLLKVFQKQNVQVPSLQLVRHLARPSSTPISRLELFKWVYLFQQSDPRVNWNELSFVKRNPAYNPRFIIVDDVKRNPEFILDEDLTKSVKIFTDFVGAAEIFPGSKEETSFLLLVRRAALLTLNTANGQVIDKYLNQPIQSLNT